MATKTKKEIAVGMLVIVRPGKGWNADAAKAMDGVTGVVEGVVPNHGFHGETAYLVKFATPVIFGTATEACPKTAWHFERGDLIWAQAAL